VKITSQAITKAEEKAELMTRAEYDWYSRNISITPEEGPMKRMELNPPQLKLSKTANTQKALGLPVRIMVLKCRKNGISTYVQSRNFTHCTVQKDISALTVAHDSDSTKTLFNMARKMYNCLPMDERLPTDNLSARELRYAHPFNSSIEMITAGGQEKARGLTPQRFHGSEIYFWPNENNFLSMLSAVPKTKDSEIFLESTGNGAAGVGYEMWLRAIERKEADPNDWEGYEPVFFSWLDTPWYRKPLNGYKLGKLDEFEYELQDLGADDEQLYWRRIIKDTDCQGDDYKFMQEMPATWEQAFRATGEGIFSKTVLDYHESWVKKMAPYCKKYRLEWKSDAREEVVAVPCSDREQINVWLIWRHPEPSGQYTVGADVSEGIALDPDEKYYERDFSAASVMDRHEKDFPATWWGRLEPDLFGEELKKAAVYFNKAWVMPEVNAPGMGTLITLRDYPKVSRRDESYDDKLVNLPLDRLGWKTHKGNRDWLITTWMGATSKDPYTLFDTKLKVYDPTVLSEERTFIRNKKGKAEHRRGAHDDMLFAHMLAYIAHLQCPIINNQKKFLPYRPKTINDLARIGAVDPGRGYFRRKSSGVIKSSF